MGVNVLCYMSLLVHRADHFTLQFKKRTPLKENSSIFQLKLQNFTKNIFLWKIASAWSYELHGQDKTFEINHHQLHSKLRGVAIQYKWFNTTHGYRNAIQMLLSKIAYLMVLIFYHCIISLLADFFSLPCTYCKSFLQFLWKKAVSLWWY